MDEACLQRQIIFTQRQADVVRAHAHAYRNQPYSRDLALADVRLYEGQMSDLKSQLTNLRVQLAMLGEQDEH